MGSLLAMISAMSPRDPALHPILEKVGRGERLSREDGITMFRSTDVVALGQMANAVKQERSGDAVYYVFNQKIEPTNVCVLTCEFCDFAAVPGAAHAYEMSLQSILDRITPEVHEVHITGGLHPTWPWEYYLEMIRSIRQRFPDVDIKAFTAVEIDFFHKKFKLSVQDVLAQLQEAGLSTMPGGGAEVFSERVREKLFHQKIGAGPWLAIHKAAHRLGIPTNATLLYGHIETIEERIDHLLRLREAQDETGGFLTFIPLAFQPGNTGIKPTHEYTSAIDDLKTIAISRLMLDNFPHIKAYWVMLTEEVATIALNFGADDMDGTVGGEKIAHDAGAQSPTALTKERLVKMIREAGKVPVERDAFFNPLSVDAEFVVGKIPYLNSVPFYAFFDSPEEKILPVVPRRMGILARKKEIISGPFSLMDYVSIENDFELMEFCIATRDQVKSVLLFSKGGWRDLEGKRIAITDDTATSIRLLHVLLEHKYGVHAEFVRLHPGVNDLRGFDAVLLIGDEALHCNKYGLPGFELVFDLAREWYEWQKLPFVFAVWAVLRSLPEVRKASLHDALKESLRRSETSMAWLGAQHGKRIGLTAEEAREFLEGFNYHLGDREREAITVFKKLNAQVKQILWTLNS
ncbi:MAG: aminofutalosine synthase MqnE [Ignavibacteriales bacterium]|nr:aminofutalosine synthase MqnE [Ignavibacteriales bacterium]